MGVRYLMGVVGLLLSQHLLAFNCYVTMVKDNCWLNYDVTVTILDTSTNQPVTVVTVPKGQSWVRQQFVCQANQNLLYTAKFSPNVWDGTGNVVYPAKKFWALPTIIRAGETAWEIPICFADAFAQVPASSTAIGVCQCNFTEIPALVPPVINK